jgi:glycosyltransferase involved in cell wall biosynthesis
MKASHLSVGVVMPVRNGARTLSAAIESVSRQEPPPGDIVVVDGSSDDGSAAIAATFAGVRVIEQKGRGLAAARNQGICEAVGDVIAFCDADDWWTAGALATRLEHLAAEPSCGAVIGQLQRTVAVGSMLTPQQASRLGRIEAAYTPGGLMVRRSAFEAVGPFDETLAIGTDSDWFVRLVQSAIRLDVLPETVLMKSVHSCSLSTDVATYRRELLQVAHRYVQRRRRGAS